MGASVRTRDIVLTSFTTSLLLLCGMLAACSLDLSGKDQCDIQNPCVDGFVCSTSGKCEPVVDAGVDPDGSSDSVDARVDPDGSLDSVDAGVYADGFFDSAGSTDST